AAQEEAVAVLPFAGGVVTEAWRGGHPEGGDRLARGGVAQFGVADQVADDRYLGVTCCHLRLRSSGIVQYRRYREGLSVVLHAQDLGPQNRLVQAELAIEFRDGVRHGVHVDDGVDALGPLVDLIGEAPAAPHVNLVHAPASRGDHAQELLQGRLDGVFLETRVEDDHHFVMAHERNCPLWTDGHGLSVTGGTASTRAGAGPAGMRTPKPTRPVAVLRRARRPPPGAGETRGLRGPLPPRGGTPALARGRGAPPGAPALPPGQPRQPGPRGRAR